MYQLIHMNKIPFVNFVEFAWSFSFDQCIVCTSSTYSFEIHFWYLKLFLDIGKIFQKGHLRFKIINNHNILCQLLKLEETKVVFSMYLTNETERNHLLKYCLIVYRPTPILSKHSVQKSKIYTNIQCICMFF